MLEPNNHTDLLLERSRILWRERHISLILKVEGGVLHNERSYSNQLKVLSLISIFDMSRMAKICINMPSI
jgi:hypothetical protein